MSAEKIWQLIEVNVACNGIAQGSKNLSEFVGRLNPETKELFEKAVSENIADQWPNNFLRRKSCGGEGVAYQGPWSSYRAVEPSEMFFLEYVGAYGAAAARRAAIEYKRGFKYPVKVYEESLTGDIPNKFEVSTLLGEEGGEKSYYWMIDFIEFANEGKLDEITYFRANGDWYSLLGYQKSGKWEMIPLPIFWRIMRKTVKAVDSMAPGAEKNLLETFPEFLVMDREEEHEC